MLFAMGVVASGLAACSRKEQPEAGPTTEPTTEPATTEPATPEPTEEPTPEYVDPFPEGVVNFLLFGTDARDAASLQGNTDSIMLAQLSADRERMTIVSMARDSWVTIGNGQGKINSAFPLGGTDWLVDVVANLFGGLAIHYTVQTNFNGFINITRWLDGIPVWNRHPSTVTVVSTGRVVEFPSGVIFLENTDGLIYARQRKGLPLGDLDRAERHRALVTGMLRVFKDLAADDGRFTEIASNVYDNVKVTGDFDRDRISDLIDPITKLDPDHITSLMLPISHFYMINGQSVNIVNETKAAALAEALNNDTIDEFVARYGED